MRALVQRVTGADVTVDGDVIASIGPGLCALVGVTHADGEVEAARLAEKLWQLRVFEDSEGKMNRAAADLELPMLVVSQFTLYADTSRGRRPSFVEAAPPEQAEPLIDTLVGRLRALGASVETGRFRARMELRLTNDGPVTLLLET
ncbi:MAG: D-tyrosyl-tRNA(Tyr) deacylase [Acidimicrobiaceae bacterium]|nr:D-tyrosyl-tRNA(Tyr) deacylase [Acidimicrobiaceae bacterium]